MNHKDALRKLIIRSLGERKEYSREEPLYYDKENGEWGYVINMQFHKVVDYMLARNLSSIVDLGAGIGDCLEICRKLGFKVKGYEIEDILVTRHLKEMTKVFVEKKDIWHLTNSDIQGYQVIYAWSPFKNEELKDQFINKVKEIMSNDQIFIYMEDKRKELEVIHKD